MLRRAGMMAALAALLAPAGMAEAAMKKKAKPPVVKSISPKTVRIGETLTLKGRHFRRGKGRNSVAFKRDGAKAVLVRSDISTARMLKVVLSDRLAEYLLVRDGVVQPTRFRIRVLARRFGKRFTARSRSPIVLPKALGASGGGTGDASALPSPEGDCDGDGAKNGVDADDDNDLLSDVTEAQIGTDACNADGDGDGVGDGYEYQSAKDLNSTYHDGFLPYPAKRPYPNALFADAEKDFDGDGLWLADEYGLWLKFGTRSLDVALVYSDGRQYSRDIGVAGYDKQAQFRADAGIGEAELLDFDANVVKGFSGGADYDTYYGVAGGYAPDGGVTDAERYYYDRDHNGKLSDDELDEDADGLSNWEEAHGPMTAGWWEHVYAKEATYVTRYAGTDMLDRDSDGDGVIDGVDDTDHDGAINLHEISRQLAAGERPAGYDGAYVRWTLGDDGDGIHWNRPREGTQASPADDAPWRAWVQPLNPCLPDPRSLTCERHPNLGALYPPFDAATPVFNVFDGQYWTPE